jgi:hypothetical protein
MQNNFHMGELGTQEKDAQRKVLSDRISKDLELIKEAKGFLPAIGIGAVTHKDSNKALADITEAQHELAALDGSPAPASGAGHPDAQAALQWAQANPTDPRAAEILKRLGH